MIEVKSTDKPDERREFPRGHLDVLELPGLSFGVATLEPGSDLEFRRGVDSPTLLIPEMTIGAA